jgi:hypothetical protein
MKFSADAAVAAAEALMAADFDPGSTKCSMASALKAMFERLRVCFEEVKQKVDVARGFDALDAACAGASYGSALELFRLRWGIFRGTAQPPEVDPFAAAIVAQDLPRLKELIGGREAGEIEVDVEKLPLDLPRRSWTSTKMKLLEIAAAVGGQVLRYLLEFHRLKPGSENYALIQAVASGEPEFIRMVWDRMDAEGRVKRSLPLVASIEFHHAEVAKWLTAEHPPWLGLARRLARENRAFDVLSRLPEGNEEFPVLSGLVGKHARALEQLGVPLGFAVRRVLPGFTPEEFDDWLFRIGQTLLLVKGNGRTFGALVAIPWPKSENAAKDVWCRSVLFALEGEEATRFPATTPPVLFHNGEKICVGELTIDLAKKEYSLDGTSSCTGGRFPAISGKVTEWGIWKL